MPWRVAEFQPSERGCQAAYGVCGKGLSFEILLSCAWVARKQSFARLCKAWYCIVQSMVPRVHTFFYLDLIISIAAMVLHTWKFSFPFSPPRLHDLPPNQAPMRDWRLKFSPCRGSEVQASNRSVCSVAFFSISCQQWARVNETQISLQPPGPHGSVLASIVDCGAEGANAKKCGGHFI